MKDRIIQIPRMEKCNKVILKPKKTIYVRCEYDLFVKLNNKRNETGISLNELTEMALREYLD